MHSIYRYCLGLGVCVDFWLVNGRGAVLNLSNRKLNSVEFYWLTRNQSFEIHRKQIEFQIKFFEKIGWNRPTRKNVINFIRTLQHRNTIRHCSLLYHWAMIVVDSTQKSFNKLLNCLALHNAQWKFIEINNFRSHSLTCLPQFWNDKHMIWLVNIATGMI